MIVITRERHNGVEFVLKCDVRKLKSGEEVIDLIYENYTPKTFFGGGRKLYDLAISRRPLSAALEQLNATKEEFFDIMNRYKEPAIIEDVFDSIKGFDISICEPKKVIKYGRIFMDRFKMNENSENDYDVFVNGVDYSNMFDGFDYFDKPVEACADVVCGAIDKVKVSDDIDQNKVLEYISDGLLGVIEALEF